VCERECVRERVCVEVGMALGGGDICACMCASERK